MILEIRTRRATTSLPASQELNLFHGPTNMEEDFKENSKGQQTRKPNMTAQVISLLFRQKWGKRLKNPLSKRTMIQPAFDLQSNLSWLKGSVTEIYKSRPTYEIFVHFRDETILDNVEYSI